jgi:hypothetical protein
MFVNCYALNFHAQNATKSDIDWLDRPPASLVVEGQLRPAFAEESTMVAKHLSGSDRDKPRNSRYILLPYPMF